MNGFRELPIHGMGAAAMASSLRAEANARRPHPLQHKQRFRLVGRWPVGTGSRVTGLGIDLPDSDCPQPA